MVLTYTTVSKIAVKLDPRVQTGGTPRVFGNVVVAPSLIDSIGVQIEAILESKLRRVYSLPLSNSHVVLTTYVEDKTVCKILPMFYSGQDISNDLGYQFAACKAADDLIEAILSKDVILEGEELLENNPIVAGYSNVQTLTPYSSNAAEDIEF